jgi:hypothetical protein
MVKGSTLVHVPNRPALTADSSNPYIDYGLFLCEESSLPAHGWSVVLYGFYFV